MAVNKTTIVLSYAQSEALQKALIELPKQTATVVALATFVGAAHNDAAINAEHKKVVLELAPSKVVALGKAMEAVKKQTKTIEKLRALVQAATLQ